MGITRSGLFKRKPTGGKIHVHTKKRKHQLGRPPALTKLVVDGEKRIRRIRTRGGHNKWRALRLNAGNYAWPSESIARKAKILEVLYSPSNTEFVRTKTLTKNTIVSVDSTPFRNWYYRHYGVSLGGDASTMDKKKLKKKAAAEKKAAEKKAADKAAEDKKSSKTKKEDAKKYKSGPSKSRQKKWKKRAATRGSVEKALLDQFESGQGKLLACIASRPGQSGRADGYILEGDELQFYLKKLEKKKKKKTK